MEELVAGGDGVVEAAEHGGRDHPRALFFDAAHDHAQVAGFDDDADALGFEGVHQRPGDLVRQAFLHLEAAGEDVGQPGELADADNPSAGDVADVADAEERQQVVFAHGIDFDVANDHHVVGVGFEERRLQQLDGILPVAAGHVGPGVGGPLRGVAQAFARGVLAQFFEQSGNQLLHSVELRHKRGDTATPFLDAGNLPHIHKAQDMRSPRLPAAPRISPHRAAGAGTTARP